MKKTIFSLCLILAVLLGAWACAQEGLGPGSTVSSRDGLELRLGEIRITPSEYDHSRDTHKWLVIDAAITNYAVEDLNICDVLGAQLSYGKYRFDGILDFGRDRIRPLVALEGRILFELPLLALEARPGEFVIEIRINGETRPFRLPERPVPKLEILEITEENWKNGTPVQALEYGACAAAESEIVLRWQAAENAQGYHVYVQNLDTGAVISETTRKTIYYLYGKLAPDSEYAVCVRPLPCLDIWEEQLAAAAGFRLAAPLPTNTPLPTPAPTLRPLPTAMPDIIEVPFGQSAHIVTEITEYGTPRTNAEFAEPYISAGFTLCVNAHRGPGYYAEKYSDRFMLTGNEAAVEFTLAMDPQAEAMRIAPQDALTMCIYNGSASTPGYRLTDREIDGNVPVYIGPGETITLCKCYDFNALSPKIGRYLTITAYQDGRETLYCFALGSADQSAS